MSHTPGPWIAVEADGVIEHKTDRGTQLIASTYPLNRIANARLIAAAPDLLAALERFIKNPNEKSNVGWCEVFKVAIAKARGETPKPKEKTP